MHVLNAYPWRLTFSAALIFFLMGCLTVVVVVATKGSDQKGAKRAFDSFATGMLIGGPFSFVCGCLMQVSQNGLQALFSWSSVGLLGFAMFLTMAFLLPIIGVRQGFLLFTPPVAEKPHIPTPDGYRANRPVPSEPLGSRFRRWSYEHFPALFKQPARAH